MTIDEAIEHAEERACGNDQCARDHAQLADWLRELRRARMEINLLKTLGDGFKAVAQKYKDENAKLRAERDYILANSNPTATELRRVRSAWKKDRDEKAKLREFAALSWQVLTRNEPLYVWQDMVNDALELGIEED